MRPLTDTHPPHTMATVVLCVVMLHMLAIGALLRSSQVVDMEHQTNIAMEMVLAPVNHTPLPAPIPTPPHPTVAPQVMTKSAAAPATQTNPSMASATHTAEATPAAPATATSRTASTHSGVPTFSLPSSDAQGLNNPKPAYPRLSRRLNEQGQVVVRVFVTVDGSAQQGEIKTSSGYDRLDQEALRTVLRWRFVPGQRLGAPEAMWFNVPVNFVLE